MVESKGERETGSTWVAGAKSRSRSARQTSALARCVGQDRLDSKSSASPPAIISGRVPATLQMLSLALTRRIARPQLAAGIPALARWYSQKTFNTDGERVIYEKLTEKFKPSELQVEDVSGL